jgi:hypothetical protein
MHARQFFIILAVVSFLPSAAAASQSTAQAVGAAAQASQVAAKGPGATDVYQVLGEERKTLERQAQRHVESMEDLYNRALNLFMAFVVVGIGLFWYVFGKTKEEMRTEIQNQIKRAASTAVEDEVSELRHRQQMLKDDVDDLTAYKFRTLIWVAPPDEDKRIEPFIRVLRTFGISRVERIREETPNIVNQRNPDLVILSFNGTEQARSLLSWLVSEIKEADPSIPLLIFTYSFGSQETRLGNDDWEILKGFDWYLPANVPATLIAQTISLLKRGRGKYESAS